MFLMSAALLSAPIYTTFAQEDHLAAQDFSSYYEWFNDRSQSELLYSHNTTLYIFKEDSKVHLGPCEDSKVLTSLPIGQNVSNIAYDDFYVPEDEINGYADMWYHVKGRNAQGRSFQGYVWGAHIAKSWRSAELTGDEQDEFIMLGVASTPRRQPTDINGEIRILHQDKLWYQKLVPGLCLFEECGSESMLRILEDPQFGFTILEASTMTLGCWAGVEKAYFYWNGSKLQRVYQAEYTTKTEFANKAFTVSDKSQRGIPLRLCHFSHEDDNYNPVWKCKEIEAKPVVQDKAIAAAP